MPSGFIKTANQYFMNTMYAQIQAPVQKKDASTATSVLDTSSQSESLQRKADMASNAAQRAEIPRQNNTGMPDNLKAGIESLSRFSMDDVRVHYNSSKPATVQALAYTQGNDIHVAPGQEKHLPHEAWHVAQQMAGRVSPTTNINGMPVNDNAALEHEADVMGEKAVQLKKTIECCKNPGIACLKVIQKIKGEGTPEATYLGIINQRTFNKFTIDDNGPLMVYDTNRPYQVHIHIGRKKTACSIDIKPITGLTENGQTYLFIATYNELLTHNFPNIAQILTNVYNAYMHIPNNFFQLNLHQRHYYYTITISKMRNMEKANNPDFWEILEDPYYDQPIVESYRKKYEGLFDDSNL